jgi:hypothetical protein
MVPEGLLTADDLPLAIFLARTVFKSFNNGSLSIL